MPVEKKCEVCGNLFRVPPSRKNKARFCSTGCDIKGRKPRTSSLVACQACGKEFRVYAAWVRKGGGKYCSRECQNRKATDNDLIASFYSDGLSSRDIAEKLSLSDTTVRRRLHEVGIEMRDPENAIRLAYTKRRGPDNANFKHYGRRLSGSGYVLVWVGHNHPQADRRGNMLEHRLVWQETEGVLLPDDWHVHHINTKRDDNRRENLLALSKPNHMTLENAIRKGEDVTELIEKFMAIEKNLIEILKS